LTDYSESKNKVEFIIKAISERDNLSYSEARTLLHKYVCEGKCNWYRTRSDSVDFDRLDLTSQDKTSVEQIVKEIMKGTATEENKVQIHDILCPGHPRSK